MSSFHEKHQYFKKLLVANRGEIAIRVFRAATELGISTVAIYTYEDRFSLHRLKADEAYQVGNDDEPLKPYLDIEAIIKIAKDVGADAIHPGYGFLSENVHFVRRCKKEGITFIGPSAEAMEKLGDKVAAKKVAKAIDVPMIEDSQLQLTFAETALAEAIRIGFPIMIKAAAGGGGRGMRVARDEEQLVKLFNEARSEAKTAFGDDTVFLEKFIDNPKHIEVQILGDIYGNIVHLFERDCSVQRRFQKVVEIAPSISLQNDTKQKLYDYALRIAKHVNYSCAGTVEFLVDNKENIYFIEVNPRVQVEHTVTEEVTGVDIVRSQILICAGHSLGYNSIGIKSQDDVICQGFAIQCRITTEDPANNFKPDYGTIIAYRSPGGFGIRLDAGSAYPGSTISPFFDSMLVKVTAWGRSYRGAVNRLYRALLEFRIRGVTTNVGFLEKLIQHQDFLSGIATVNFIAEHPELLIPQNRKDRGTKLLRYIAENIVNGNSDIAFIDPYKVFRQPNLIKVEGDYKNGTKQLLDKLGAIEFSKWLKNEKQIHYTDTTLRDAHQSLLATRLRTFDMLKIAEKYAKVNGDKIFSMEVWGGATFDVALRFLHECPWQRLRLLRKAMPNTLLQMLFRGSNAVGYSAYPNNLVEKFIIKAYENGIDIFRIFDSLNWVDAMKTSIKTVRTQTNAIAEASICYTGDILDKKRNKKFSIQYYIDLAKELEDCGAHILAIKDMAGLLKPYSAEVLINQLKEQISIPIHLHTHDTSSIQSATYLKAIEAGVDVIDVALSSMSGLTSQPNFNSIVAMMQGQERENPINIHSLNEFSNYWETIREYYYPFEGELKAGTAEVYDHEIPGGQYTNLRPQARGLGLEDKFETIKDNFKIANQLFGDIVKVTPSSKVVGDMAMFMTANNLSENDIFEKGNTISFPDSVKSLMRGDLGQPKGGFPANLQTIILKDEQAFTEHPNAHLQPINFEEELKLFREKFGINASEEDYLSFKMFPKVFEDYFEHYRYFGNVEVLPTPVFFFGLQPNEEILIEIDTGKTLLISYMNKTKTDVAGNCSVLFKYNGTARSIDVKDKTVKVEKQRNEKVSNTNHIGAPLQGSLSKIYVKEGDAVKKNQPLFVIEAMKMETVVTATKDCSIEKIYLQEKHMVEQDDLVISVG